MRRRRQIRFLAVSFLLLVALIYLIWNFPPSFQFSIFNFSILPLFFTLFFLFIYFLFSFILANKRRGFLIGLFAIIFLFLRLNYLTEPFFLILLLILFGSVELLFAKRK